VTDVVAVRPFSAEEAPALRVFLAGLPEGERRWFEEDVLDPSVVASWAADERGRHLLAFDAEDHVVVYGAVRPGRGWSSHVGEITLLVDPRARRQGHGKTMARLVLVEALRAGLTKVVVEVVADETAAVAMFGLLGFEPEALLRGHVRDRHGRIRDLMVLAHPVEENWAVMAATGVEDALV
jgi:ribosomal protein S18 acetylase RimI-like enzyme